MQIRGISNNAMAISLRPWTLFSINKIFLFEELYKHTNKCVTMRWQWASVREHYSRSWRYFYLKNLQTHKQMGYNAMAMSLCLHYSALRSSRYRQMSTSTFWENLLNVCCQDAVVGKLLNCTVFDIYIRKWFNAEVLSLLERDASIIFMFRALSCKIL